MPKWETEDKKTEIGQTLHLIWLSGKKVGRREDLLNIEVSGSGRIRQRDPGVGFSLLV
jgi:hypothetical protein